MTNTSDTTQADLKRQLIALCEKHRITESINYQDVSFEDAAVSFITAYTNTQKAELLDRLSDSMDNLQTYKFSDTSTDVLIHKQNIDSAIARERKRLENE